jgi:hypothetical protein
MAKQNRKDQASNERAVFNGPVKAQRGNIFKVVSQGVCIEYTDQLNDANSAYKEAAKPKTMFKITRDTGAVGTVYHQVV